mmetsp:Transcript_48388/g.109823  ORF Transcript_48388/g.109823 Transcript_48388/m.109823 type:complete len:429 (-) Transcript_48388:111-1397(-)
MSGIELPTVTWVNFRGVSGISMAGTLLAARVFLICSFNLIIVEESSWSSMLGSLRCKCSTVWGQKTWISLLSQGSLTSPKAGLTDLTCWIGASTASPSAPVSVTVSIRLSTFPDATRPRRHAPGAGENSTSCPARKKSSPSLSGSLSCSPRYTTSVVSTTQPSSVRTRHPPATSSGINPEWDRACETYPESQSNPHEASRRPPMYHWPLGPEKIHRWPPNFFHVGHPLGWSSSTRRYSPDTAPGDLDATTRECGQARGSVKVGVTSAVGGPGSNGSASTVAPQISRQTAANTPTNATTTAAAHAAPPTRATTATRAAAAAAEPTSTLCCVGGTGSDGVGRGAVGDGKPSSCGGSASVSWSSRKARMDIMRVKRDTRPPSSDWPSSWALAAAGDLFATSCRKCCKASRLNPVLLATSLPSGAVSTLVEK